MMTKPDKVNNHYNNKSNPWNKFSKYMEGVVGEFPLFGWVYDAFHSRKDLR